MKKILFVPALALLLSCNNGKTTYTKCEQTTYNFNKEAANQLISAENKEGSFTVEVTGNSIKIIDNTGKEKVLKNDNGYSLINKKSGDTLIIENLPTQETPDNILKFGATYKFYN